MFRFVETLYVILKFIELFIQHLYNSYNCVISTLLVPDQVIFNFSQMFISQTDHSLADWSSVLKHVQEPPAVTELNSYFYIFKQSVTTPANS